MRGRTRKNSLSFPKMKPGSTVIRRVRSARRDTGAGSGADYSLEVVMTFAAHRRLGIAAFALGLLPVLTLLPASAETAPAGRSWTDPPPREAHEVKAGEGQGRETKDKVAAPAVSGAPGPVAAPRRTVATAARPRKVAARPAPRRVAAARPAAPRRPVVAALPRSRVTAPAPRPAIRAVTMRPAVAPPMARYGYAVEAAPDRSGVFVGGRMFEDDRAARVRRAQEAGYIVVRSRTVEFPDGRRLRTYQPLDEEADD